MAFRHRDSRTDDAQITARSSAYASIQTDAMQNRNGAPDGNTGGEKSSQITLKARQNRNGDNASELYLSLPFPRLSIFMMTLSL
jgi:hypothetical protein